MVRQLRIEYPGVFYHGPSKGNQRGVYFGIMEEDGKFKEVNRIKAAMAQ